MASERGIVTRVTPKAAWVKTVRSDACAHCEAKGYCKAVGDDKEVEVEALNPAGAGIGDRVVISFETGSFLKANFLLYVFPILMMIAGALAGQRLAPSAGIDESAAAVIGSLLLFLPSMVFVLRRANHLGRQDAYRPKITRVLRRS